MNILAEVFKTSMALEGGMFLRLLNCPRSTQDVDYVMVSSESKKTLAKRIGDVLAKIENTKIESVEINSRGIFFRIANTENSSIKASVEIKVQPEWGAIEFLLSTLSSIYTSSIVFNWEQRGIKLKILDKIKTSKTGKIVLPYYDREPNIT